MSQIIDIGARMRSCIAVARMNDPADVDRRARGFIALLAGTLQEESPQLAAELFALLINANMSIVGGVQ